MPDAEMPDLGEQNFETTMALAFFQYQEMLQSFRDNLKQASTLKFSDLTPGVWAQLIPTLEGATEFFHQNLQAMAAVGPNLDNEHIQAVVGLGMDAAKKDAEDQNK